MGGKMAYVGPITPEGKNRIMIYGPKDDGTYVVEFKTAAGDALAISVPRTDAAVIQHFSKTDAIRAVRARDGPLVKMSPAEAGLGSRMGTLESLMAVT